jgi:hypothetical protein
LTVGYTTSTEAIFNRFNPTLQPPSLIEKSTGVLSASILNNPKLPDQDYPFVKQLLVEMSRQFQHFIRDVNTCGLLARDI